MPDQQKTIAIVIPSGANGVDTVLQEVTVLPGSTARDVLNSVGRGSGYILGTLAGHVFGARDLIFGQVADGEKLAITPSAEAGASAPAPQGAGFLAWLGYVLSGGPGSPTSGSRLRAPVATPAPARSAVPGTVVRVAPVVRPAWQEKGWAHKGRGVYEGLFATPFGPCRGRVEFGSYGFRRLYIWHPPRELWTAEHPHRYCFDHLGSGKYEVHMRVPPTSVDAAILNTERMFSEAYQRLHGRPYA